MLEQKVEPHDAQIGRALLDVRSHVFAPDQVKVDITFFVGENQFAPIAGFRDITEPAFGEKLEAFIAHAPLGERDA